MPPPKKCCVKKYVENMNGQYAGVPISANDPWMHAENSAS